MKPIRTSAAPTIVLAALSLGAFGCRPNNMGEQNRYEYLESSDVFEDGRAARPLPQGTVPRDAPLPSSPIRTGLDDAGAFLQEMPLPVTANLLQRGQERYEIYCSVCHGSDGYGTGIVVRRGFPAPPSFHTDRLRQAPIGYFSHVINKGYGVMYSYASRVPPDDRWAIAAYIRALQFSQNAPVSQLDDEDKRKLQEVAP